MATIERRLSTHSDPAPAKIKHIDDTAVAAVMNALSAQLLHAPSSHAAQLRAVPAQPSQVVQRQAEHVRGQVAYTKPTPTGEELFTYVYKTADGEMPGNLVTDEREVSISDLHTAQRQFSLQENGFQLEPLQVPGDIDWNDDADVTARYYPAIVDLLKRTAGASRVHVFDHTIRRGFIGEMHSSNGVDQAKRTPVSRVHVDYNSVSGVNRLHQLLPDQAADLQKTPFAVIQVWKPLKGPVKSSPLGMIDAATVAKSDYMDLRIQFEARTGYNYALKYNPAHQWYYAKDMAADEAYVFTCYDSRNGRARFTPHTGFADPTTPEHAPQRESIEIRAYVFWENEPEQPIATEL